MSELSDKYILGKIRNVKENQDEPGFSLEDLVGKTIEQHREIRSSRKPNPREFYYSADYIDVIVFSDRTFLATENWTDGECVHLKYYFFNGKKTLYSDELFGLL